MLGNSGSQSSQRGDTLIEVLLAITVFSLVAVGGLSIMNTGVSSAQRSLEVTLVRQQIDAQSEALRFVHHSYVSAYNPQTTTYNGPAAAWKDIVDSRTVPAAKPFGAIDNSCPDIRTEAFVMNARTARVDSAPITSMSGAGSRPYSQVVYGDDTEVIDPAGADAITSVQGIWIEAVQANDPDAGSNKSVAVDFHVRACWNSPGSNLPVTIGTIVRLYDPRS